MEGRPNYPDGLTPAVIDVLIAEAEAVTGRRFVAPRFADRGAVRRGERRRAHRVLTRVARSLPRAGLPGEGVAA